jgi:hypothetical protein
MSEHKVKRRLGRFALAAMIYVAGVVAFSYWSFTAQRKLMLQTVDKSLSDAAFAVREILGDDYSESLATVGNTNSAVYATRQKQLGRYAKNSALTAVGAAARNQSGTYSIIAGTADRHDSSQKPVASDAVLPSTLAEMVLDMASAANDHGMVFLTFDHPLYGRLRVAAYYKGQTDGTSLAYLVTKEVDSVNVRIRQQATGKAASGCLLLALAIPLVLLYNTAQHRASKELTQLNAQLREDVTGQKARELELKDAIRDLKRFNAVSAGREIRIIELKGEVNALLIQMNKQKRYNIDKAD